MPFAVARTGEGRGYERQDRCRDCGRDTAISWCPALPRCAGDTLNHVADAIRLSEIEWVHDHRADADAIFTADGACSASFLCCRRKGQRHDRMAEAAERTNGPLGSRFPLCERLVGAAGKREGSSRSGHAPTGPSTSSRCSPAIRHLCRIRRAATQSRYRFSDRLHRTAPADLRRAAWTQGDRHPLGAEPASHADPRHRKRLGRADTLLRQRGHDWGFIALTS